MTVDIKSESLKKLGVYELRELARKLGVHSPTTKVRKVLEAEIIENSQKEGITPQKRKGRPPKSVKTQSVEDALDVFLPKTYSEIILIHHEDKEDDDLMQFRKDSAFKEAIAHEIIGYVRMTQNGKYYVRAISDAAIVATISKKKMDEFNLFLGDKVRAYVAGYEGDEFLQLQTITLLNNEPVVPKRKLDDLCTDVVLTDAKVEKLDIEEGGKLLFVADSMRESAEKLAPIYTSLQNDYHVVVYAPGISTYQCLMMQKNFKGDFIFALTEDHPVVVFESVDNVKNHIDILTRQKKKVVLFVFDLMAAKNGLQEYLAILSNNMTVKEDIESTKFCMKLVNLSRVLENGASVTVVAVCMKEDQNTNFYNYSLKKAVDKILFL